MAPLVADMGLAEAVEETEAVVEVVVEVTLAVMEGAGVVVVVAEEAFVDGFQEQWVEETAG